jgi:hypothetical protein
MKLSLQSLQALNRLSDYQEQLVTLQATLDTLQKEKREQLSQREEHIARLKGEVNALEQQLIQAKLDAATVKTQLQEEKNRALLMKKQIKDQQRAA